MAGGMITTRDSYQATTKAMEFAYSSASNAVAPQFQRLFNTQNFDPIRSEATIGRVIPMGLMKPRQIEGAAFPTDSPTEGIPSTFVFGTWGLSSYTTDEARTEDPLNLTEMVPQMLANAERYTLDFTIWDTINFGFSTLSPGYDGLPLFSNVHPLGVYIGDDGAYHSLTGQTFSNSLGAAPFVPETLRQVEILLETLRDDRGNPDYRQGQYLVCNPYMAKTIQEVSGAKLAPYSSENQPNTAEGLYQLMVIRYIQSPTFWGLFCGPGDWRMGGNTNSLIASFKYRGRQHAWYDNPTGNYGIRAQVRFAYGFVDWRGSVAGSM